MRTLWPLSLSLSRNEASVLEVLEGMMRTLCPLSLSFSWSG